MKKILILLSIYLIVCETALMSQALTKDSLAKNPKLFLQVARKGLSWDQPADPFHIAGPIYFVGTKGLSSFLITTSAGHILVYTGMPGSGEMIEASVRKLGFKPADIKYILTGHAHIDHAGGHAYMKKLTNATVALMAEEQQLLESGGKTDFHYGGVPDFIFEPVKVDRVLRSGDELVLGEIRMTALLTPGHTRGSTTWVTEFMEKGRNYKVVFPDGTSINPGYRVSIDPSYHGIESDLRSTLHTLALMKPDIWLSCHTDFMKLEEKKKLAVSRGIDAWLDLDGYQQKISTNADELEESILKERKSKISGTQTNK